MSPFKSKKQQAYFYEKAKTSPKWKKMAQEWSSATDFSSLPNAVKSLRKKYRKKNG